ncbi:unnamed protein product [Calypogeia fissa]
MPREVPRVSLWGSVVIVVWSVVALVYHVVSIICTSLEIVYTAVDAYAVPYLRQEVTTPSTKSIPKTVEEDVRLLPPLPDIVVSKNILTLLRISLDPSDLFDLRCLNRSWRDALSASEEWAAFQTMKRDLERYSCPSFIPRAVQLRLYWEEFRRREATHAQAEVDMGQKDAKYWEESNSPVNYSNDDDFSFQPPHNEYDNDCHCSMCSEVVDRYVL